MPGSASSLPPSLSPPCSHLPGKAKTSFFLPYPLSDAEVGAEGGREGGDAKGREDTVAKVVGFPGFMLRRLEGVEGAGREEEA